MNNANNFNKATQSEILNGDEVEENNIVEESEYFGYRLALNVWPTSKELNGLFPNGCVYTPLTPCGLIESDPIICTKCNSFLSPLSKTDVQTLSWICVFCGCRNQLPRNVMNDPDFANTGVLPETDIANTTIEYLNKRAVPFSPTFVFIIDRATFDKERHELMIRGVQEAFDLLPDESNVAFIMFGTNIEVGVLSKKKIQTIYLFSGENIYNSKDLKGINDMREILVKKGERIEEINRLIERLEKDPFPVAEGFRPNRCTGSAISLAISLVSSYSDNPLRYLLFTQGPCTFGPGQVASIDISAEMANSNLDSARKVYDDLAKRISKDGHTIDIIAETLADIGLVCMESMISLNGGLIIMAQDFEEFIKINSLRNLFRKTDQGLLEMGFNAQMQIKTSANVRFEKIYGEGSVVDSRLSIGSLLPNSSFTLIFQPNELSSNNTYGYVQIITTYQRSDRSIVTHVTSFSRLFSNDTSLFKSGFDYKAAGVVVARSICQKVFEKVLDIETMIDRHLIQFTRMFASFYKNTPSSVTFIPAFEDYLKQMFFFRRSTVVQKEGISQDEHKYFRILLFKLPVEDAVKLIKPMLLSFHYQGDIAEVPLDVSSLDPESMIVLDSYHNVLLWFGQDVEGWKRQKIHEKKEFEFFKNSIKNAEDFANSLIVDRLPTPQFKSTAAGKSQERILLNYINPGNSGEVNTQRIDYDKFYNTLAAHVTKSE